MIQQMKIVLLAVGVLAGSAAKAEYPAPTLTDKGPVPSAQLPAYLKSGGVVPTDPPSMSVEVSYKYPGLPLEGNSGFRVATGAPTFDPPEIRDWQTTAKAPRDFAAWYEPWQPWPRKGKDKRINTIELGPRRDPDGVLILGALFRSVLAESVVVASADGAKTFVMDEDFKYNARWGQIANIDGRLGVHEQTDVKVRCRYATQRIDLVQLSPNGGLSVKRGEPAIVCPALPEPDTGQIAIAGVYIAPWRRDGKFVITAEDIFPISPADPAAPINPQAVSRTLAKLRKGEKVTIAMLGASITVGAEAGLWWDESRKFTAKDTAWRGRVIRTLRGRFPDAEIAPLEASRGGKTTQYGVEVLRGTVIPAGADVVIISFGGNDASSAIGREPRNPPERFKALMTDLVRNAKAAGLEVILIVGMQKNPWLRSGIARRWPKYRQAILDVGREQGVGVADVYAEWMNLSMRGIPPFSQLHNWNNHPGAFGHKVYADVILRFFEQGD